MKLFRPEVFQGNLYSKKYFEGWYYKNVSPGLDHVCSFIPGVSLNKTNPHAFIQYIDGIEGKTLYFEYPLETFRFEKKKLFTQVGRSVFTDTHIELDIAEGDNKITGKLEFNDSVRYPSSLLSPGIMGWYSFVPFMECKHGVVSVNHKISGKVNISGKVIDFSGGKGYIEKDWGRSFPEAWIWFQTNHFTEPDTSLMISIAKIPWLGSYFTGFLGFLYVNGIFYPFSTYNGSKIKELKYHDKELRIVLENRDHYLRIFVNHKNSGDLRAPVLGKMDRIIKESIDSEVRIELFDKAGQKIFDDTGKRAGLEIIDKIFDIAKKDLKLEN